MIEPSQPVTSTNAASSATLTGAVTSELYDSGAIQNMTPYKDALVNYEVIVPKPINAANQQTFQAIGWGDLSICVPNGQGSTHITLKDVLHTLDIALMLVSIRLIDQARYTVSFTGRTCIICDMACKIVGCFPKREGLYKVDTHHNESVAASILDTSLGMADAHRRLGHISPDAI